jgi:hypothetical protein
MESYLEYLKTKRNNSARDFIISIAVFLVFYLLEKDNFTSLSTVIFLFFIALCLFRLARDVRNYLVYKKKNNLLI